MKRKRSLAVAALLVLLANCSPLAARPRQVIESTVAAIPSPTPGLANPSSSARAAPTLGEAYQAAVEHLDLDRAVQLYQQIAAAGSPAARTQARLALAWLDWRVYNRPEVARESLSRIIDQNGEEMGPLLALWRMEMALHDYPAAREATGRALELARTRSQVWDAQATFAWATIEEAVLARLVSDQVQPGQADPAGLQEALILLRDIVEAAPGHLQLSQLLLQAALLLDDGESALLAWRSYYWVSPDHELERLLIEPYAALQDILPRWQGPASPAEDREALIQALADSRLFTEAALIALDPRGSGTMSAEAHEVAAYARFLRRLQEAIETRYREALAGQQGPGPKALFRDQLEAFCQEVRCLEDNDLRSNRAFAQAQNWIRERFGARWWFARYHRSDLFMGHVIVDEERTIEQYGQSATFRLISLDGLVSHGTRSWVFDNPYHVGAFASRNPRELVEFRPFRVNLLMGLARRIIDPETREAIEESAPQARLDDERLAAENPYAGLPGLRGRLIQRSLEGLWAEASQGGLEGWELQMAFLAALDQVWWKESGLAHEGRHFIDYQAGGTGNAELEFAAKLAETAFCRYPGIPLGNNVLHPGFGPNGHGDANLLITQGLVAWMESHADEIRGLDTSRPLLPQLDLLSDDQLRAAARSLDPLVGREGLTD